MSDSIPRWHILNDQNQQEGPISEETLHRLFATGSVKSTTAVWTPTLAEWSTYEKQFPPKNQITEILPQVPSRKDSQFFGGIHRPWRRCFARFVDLNLFGKFVLLCLLFVINGVTPEIGSTINGYLLDPLTSGTILLLAWLPFECALISLTGSTPGKWLFGIGVRSSSGSKLLFGASLKRYISMMIQGVGLCIPIVAFFTQIYSYKQLTLKGTTAWDKASNAIVSHAEPLSWRYFTGTVGVILAFSLVVVYRTLAKQ
jgi:uncharacterized RDD family membrane protein YckC